MNYYLKGDKFMLNKFENYNINKFTETLQKFIINDGYRILSAQSSNGGKTEVIVLTKVEDLTQLNYKILKSQLC